MYRFLFAVEWVGTQNINSTIKDLKTKIPSIKRPSPNPTKNPHIFFTSHQTSDFEILTQIYLKIMTMKFIFNYWEIENFWKIFWHFWQHILTLLKNFKVNICWKTFWSVNHCQDPLNFESIKSINIGNPNMYDVEKKGLIWLVERTFEKISNVSMFEWNKNLIIRVKEIS